MFGRDVAAMRSINDGQVRSCSSTSSNWLCDNGRELNRESALNKC
jgi:hypothetical protein